MLTTLTPDQFWKDFQVAESRLSPKEPTKDWFMPGNREHLDLLINLHRPKIVLELGAWLGASTLWFARNPVIEKVITLDHWLGAREHIINADDRKILVTLWDQFNANCASYRDKIHPLRTDVTNGIYVVKDYGIQPDLIYLDASHDTESVLSNLHILKDTFPDAILTGDDFYWESVQRALQMFVPLYRGARVRSHQNFWHLDFTGKAEI